MIKKELNPMHGKRLIECLKDARMTQKELAERSGYTPQHINNIVRGKRNMSQEASEIFANILEVYPTYLTGRRSFKNKEEAHHLSLERRNSHAKTLHAFWEFNGCCITRLILISEEGKEFNLDPVSAFTDSAMFPVNFLGPRNINDNIENIVDVRIYAKEVKGESDILIDTDLFIQTLYFLNDYADHICRKVIRAAMIERARQQKASQSLEPSEN